ncbi:MAG: F0F1 ATP synthase subunit delta, partial [Planctomycetales bacterium]|nr:F0F1 ATP synthase subunit delta [Planctomycetales bacterium]
MTQQQSSRDTVLDIDVQRLAQIYGQAALDAAGDKEAQSALVDEFGEVGELLQANPKLEALFGSELIGQDEKLALLDRLFGQTASTNLLNTLRVMARHGRLGAVRG